MTFKQLKNNTFFKIATNRYVLILVAFTGWMLFFDANSYLKHHAYNTEIEELEMAIHLYKSKIESDTKTIKMLQDSVQLQKFAREKYLMKKENETIYIVEFETQKK